MNIYVTSDTQNRDHYFLMADYAVRARLIVCEDDLLVRTVGGERALTAEENLAIAEWVRAMDSARERNRQEALYVARQAQVVPYAKARPGMRIVSAREAKRIHAAGLSA